MLAAAKTMLETPLAELVVRSGFAHMPDADIGDLRFSVVNAGLRPATSSRYGIYRGDPADGLLLFSGTVPALDPGGQHEIVQTITQSDIRDLFFYHFG